MNPISAIFDKLQHGATSSNVARLVNMRIADARRCNCRRCDDLLSKIHFNGTKLHREHDNEKYALKFWTNNLPNSYSADFGFHEDSSTQSTLEELQYRGHFVDSLVTAEREWQEVDDVQCIDSPSDDYWIKRYQSVQSLCRKLRNDMDMRV